MPQDIYYPQNHMLWPEQKQHMKDTGYWTQHLDVVYAKLSLFANEQNFIAKLAVKKPNCDLHIYHSKLTHNPETFMGNVRMRFDNNGIDPTYAQIQTTLRANRYESEPVVHAGKFVKDIALKGRDAKTTKTMAALQPYAFVIYDSVNDEATVCLNDFSHTFGIAPSRHWQIMHKGKKSYALATEEYRRSEWT